MLFNKMKWFVSVLFYCITYSFAQVCEDERQEWNNCASACGSPSCLDAFYTGAPPIFCTADCRPRCECKRDIYTLGLYGKGCIPIADCPKTITCPEDRIYREKSCPIFCNDRTATCEEPMKGCFCPEGLFEDEKGNCLPADYCPLGCYGGTIEDSCASACQPTCLNPRPNVCPPFPCIKQCVCAPPLVENENGWCVDIDDCPKCKIEGMVYQECGNCQPTCENYQFLDCPMDCIKGCWCQSGTVFDENRNKCIPPEFCTCPVSAE